MTGKITITLEITMAELQKALLPNGGKITNLEVNSGRRVPPKKPVAKKKRTAKTPPKGEPSGSKK